jgi:heme-binding NEAT domain protein
MIRLVSIYPRVAGRRVERFDWMDAFKFAAGAKTRMSDDDHVPDERAEAEDRVDATGDEATGMSDEDPGAQEARVSSPDKETETKTPLAERTTAPQSPYTMGQVGIGFAVLLVGLLIAFGIPLLL